MESDFLMSNGDGDLYQNHYCLECMIGVRHYLEPDIGGSFYEGEAHFLPKEDVIEYSIKKYEQEQKLKEDRKEPIS